MRMQIVEDYIESLITESTLKNPAWNIEKKRQGKEAGWDYIDGCMNLALLAYYDTTGKESVLQFSRNYISDKIMADGAILTYDQKTYNLDNINGGKTLFTLLDLELKENPDKYQAEACKYKVALDSLYHQLITQPRTEQGNFWHKQIYPQQVWLDGLYMVMPFYAEYQKRFSLSPDYSDIDRQFRWVEENMRDSATGLYYHANDTSRQMYWCNPRTGNSKHFWLRSLGWFAMAMLDTLLIIGEAEGDIYLHLKSMFLKFIQAMLTYQSENGMWYQIIDLAKEEKNYPETSGTAIFAYCLLKGARIGLLDSSCQEAGKRAFLGICKTYLTCENQRMKLGGICLVAGLGGPQKRDGSYAYYMSEPIVEDDAKGTAPFILAYTEMIRLQVKQYTNPILTCDYSDPDVIRVEQDYYMVASSFNNSPGVPVLHSVDLIHWKVINYAVEQIPGDRYRTPQHGCGIWAPSIRYHDDIFYIFFPMPDEGIYMTQTKDPYSKWSEPVCIKEAKGYIDPCPLWDDKGSAYLVTAFAKSRIGFKSILHLTEMNLEATKVYGEGTHIYDGNKTQPTIEGPKIYKRKGFYYIFAPAGGVKVGWQTVLRSRDIWGPYEERIVMKQGDTEINGPHQGAWIDDLAGNDWFIHFQDVGALGRIVHLQPMQWEDDWPIIGKRCENNSYGVPVYSYDVPFAYKTNTYEEPACNDDFSKGSLGLQWQWNANFRSDWYQCDGENKSLRLNAVPFAGKFYDNPAILLQKWPYIPFTITTKIDYSQMKEGEFGGLITLGKTCSAVAIKRVLGDFDIMFWLGDMEQNSECKTIEGHCENATIWLRMEAQKNQILYFYSEDGERFNPIGSICAAREGIWVGAKSGLFATSENENSECGAMIAEYFTFERKTKEENMRES